MNFLNDKKYSIMGKKEGKRMNEIAYLTKKSISIIKKHNKFYLTMIQ